MFDLHSSEALVKMGRPGAIGRAFLCPSISIVGGKGEILRQLFLEHPAFNLKNETETMRYPAACSFHTYFDG